MTQHRHTSLLSPAACTIFGLLAALPAIASADALTAPPPRPIQPSTVRQPQTVPPRAAMAVTVAEPAAEVARPAGNALASPFGTRLPAATGQTLTAPVTVNANTSTDGLTVTQSGTGRAITGSVTGVSNGLSAVKGITAGSGSGMNGVNSGTAGQAGKFEITNGSSNQPSVLATTAGNGTAVQGIVKGTASTDAPAVLGQHTGAGNHGIGVEGDGGSIGVKGTSTGIGYGVYGYAPDATGTSAYTYGVYGESPSSVAVAGDTTGGIGVWGSSTNFLGVYGHGANYAGVKGYSEKSYGVWGVSDSGNGVVGESTSGYAGLFYGPVYASGAMTAASYGYTSDRALKQEFASVDGADVLDRVAAMPITSWDYTERPAERHIGPMAQDFRAAFGLGTDDKHIDVVDGIGVSLAAIQELQRQAKAKDARAAEQDARIAALEGQLQAMHLGLDARMAALEQATAAAVVGARAP